MAGGPDVPHSTEILPTERGFQGASNLSVHRAFVVHLRHGGCTATPPISRPRGASLVRSSGAVVVARAAAGQEVTCQRAVLEKTRWPHQGRRQASLRQPTEGRDSQCDDWI